LCLGSMVLAAKHNGCVEVSVRCNHNFLCEIV